MIERVESMLVELKTGWERDGMGSVRYDERLRAAEGLRRHPRRLLVVNSTVEVGFVMMAICGA